MNHIASCSGYLGLQAPPSQDATFTNQEWAVLLLEDAAADLGAGVHQQMLVPVCARSFLVMRSIIPGFMPSLMTAVQGHMTCCVQKFSLALVMKDCMLSSLCNQLLLPTGTYPAFRAHTAHPSLLARVECSVIGHCVALQIGLTIKGDEKASQSRRVLPRCSRPVPSRSCVA